MTNRKYWQTNRETLHKSHYLICKLLNYLNRDASKVSNCMNRAKTESSDVQNLTQAS